MRELEPVPRRKGAEEPQRVYAGLQRPPRGLQPGELRRLRGDWVGLSRYFGISGRAASGARVLACVLKVRLAFFLTRPSSCTLADHALS